MKNDANIRNFIEISGNMHGKSRKMRGKSGNFRGIQSSKWQNRREILRSFPVIFGRFRSHFRSFLDMIPILSVFFPFLFLFIPFHSFSFLIFKLYYYFCTGIYSINCSYEENYSNFSHHFYGYWR